MTERNPLPTKVTVEITANGYRKTVWAGDQVLSQRTSVMESRGRARGTAPGDVIDDLPEEHGDLAEEIDSIELGVFGIAGELMELTEAEETADEEDEE